jgi:predicted O-linked N-acetylglucosamine transferase (SPINDLY family)
MPDFRIQELMAQAVEHHRTGKLAQAEAVYRQVLELQPDFPDALNNLGAALQLSGRVDEAIAAYRQALTHQPDSPDFHYNLGMALRRKDQTEEAIDAFSQAIAHRPDWPDACLNLGYLLQADGRVAEAIAVYRQGLRFAPHRHEIRSNLLCALLLDPNQDPQTVFREHQQWNEHHAAPLQGDIRAHPNDRSSDRCLKVGYVSADFREHSVAYFIEGLLEKHDPAQVETFCYADLPALPDEFTARLRQRAHHWRDITGMADQRLAQTIREDQIDLLIDLAGHTARNRLLVFARKPAPVQVSYLGYPATTGLDGIDYYLTDAWADSAEMTQPYFTPARRDGAISTAARCARRQSPASAGWRTNNIRQLQCAEKTERSGNHRVVGNSESGSVVAPVDLRQRRGTARGHGTNSRSLRPPWNRPAATRISRASASFKIS